MKRKSKWRRQHDSHTDRKQTFLDPTSPKGMQERMPPSTIETTVYAGKFFCPFCLYIGKLGEFRVQTKKGWSEKKAQCPDCKNGMMMKSLIVTQTVEEYAEWVYMYAASGFWQKIPFTKFCRRLKDLGWSYRFWGRYKALKGEATGESYEEHLDRQQEEWAREQGYI